MRKLKNIGTRSLGIRTLTINGRHLTGEVEVTEYVAIKKFDCNNSYGVVVRDFLFLSEDFEAWMKKRGGKWELL